MADKDINENLVRYLAKFSCNDTGLLNGVNLQPALYSPERRQAKKMLK